MVGEVFAGWFHSVFVLEGSRSNWLHRVALGGILVALAWGVHAQEAQQPANAPERQQQTTPAPDLGPTLRAIFNEAIEKFAREKAESADAEKRKEYREESDLAAQWAQTTWASIAAIAAALSLALSSVTLYFLWKTFKETQRTADASQAASLAAISAAKSAEAGLQVNRAWMTNNGMTMYYLSGGSVDGVPVKNAFGLSIRWKNAGASPALEATIVIKQALVPYGAPIPTFDADAAKGDNFSAMVGPNQEVSSQTVAFNDAQSDSIRNRTATAVIYCRVTYRDIYSAERRHSENCFRVEYQGVASNEPDGLKSDRLGLAAEGPQNTGS